MSNSISNKKLLNYVSKTCLLVFFTISFGSSVVTTSQGLIDALANATPGTIINIGPGNFLFSAPLDIKTGITLKGSGLEKTVLAADTNWKPGTSDLPDEEMKYTSANQNAYLLNLGTNRKKIILSDLTLTGPSIHGAILCNNCDSIEVFNAQIKDFLWAGIRTWGMKHTKIHDNIFIDAGGEYKWTSGALFMTWFSNSEFWNNRISKSPGSKHQFYGFKGREGRNSRIHHNDVSVDFSAEFPFENDNYMEIDHNHFTGCISIPKYAGGPVPTGGYTFHIHHNWLTTSYQLEWSRNGAEIDHNLFDFDTNKDGGNLISQFGNVAYPGPTLFHDNLIKNPGRGVFWGDANMGGYSFYNNHVIANKTITPRTDGLFGFSAGCTFSTISIKNNIFECIGLARPMVRNSASYAAQFENNTFINISDSAKITNPSTGAAKGPVEPLVFTVGVNDEYTVNGWTVAKTGAPVRPRPNQKFMTTVIRDYTHWEWKGKFYSLHGVQVSDK